MRRTHLWLALAQGMGLTAQAATITVETTDDTSALECTLRDAIISANTDLPSGACPPGAGDDTIEFNLTFPATLSVGSALPAITSGVTIAGPGATDLSIDLADSFGLAINPGAGVSAALNDLTVRGGYAPLSYGEGAIEITSGTVSLTGVAVTENTQVYSAVSIEGATLNLNSSEVSDSAGGVFARDAVLNMTSATFRGNSAFSGSAFIAVGGSVVNASYLTVTDNTHTVAAISLRDIGDSTIENCTISGNVNEGSGQSALRHFSGGTLRVRDCTFTNNSGFTVFSAFGPTDIASTEFSSNDGRIGIYIRGTSIVADDVVATGHEYQNLKVIGTTATISNSTFNSNQGTNQSGLDVSADVATLTNITASNNAGFGIRISSDNGSLSDSLVSNNALGGMRVDAPGGGTVTLDNVDIIGNGYGVTSSFGGGGIVSRSSGAATLQIDNSTIASNTAGGEGGGIQLVGYDKSLVMRNSTIANNVAATEGGAIWANRLRTAIDLTDVIIEGNVAAEGGGIHLEQTPLTGTGVIVRGNEPGGIFAIESDVSLVSSSVTDNVGRGIEIVSPDAVYGNSLTISGNTASSEVGGGIYVSGKAGFGPPSTTFELINATISANSAHSGGGISLSNVQTVSLQNPTFTGNAASEDGGGLHVTSAFFNFETPTTITGGRFEGNVAGGSGGGMHLPDMATLDGAVITGNTADQCAGGYFGSNTTLSTVTITGNTATGSGGGLCSEDAYFAMEDSVVAYNVASGYAGGLRVRGGFFSYLDDSASAAVRRSAIYGNEATQGAGIQLTRQAFLIENSTLSQNTASETGSALDTLPYTYLRIFQSTLAGNTVTKASANAAAVTFEDGGYDLVIANSVIASPDRDCYIGDSASVTAMGENHFSDTSCVGAADGDPLLAEVADNGGPTPTQFPRQGSPLLDAGDLATCLDTDQRGEPRNVLTVCDIGAVEVQTRNNPPRIDDQRLLVFTPVADQQVLGQIDFDDPDLPLDPGAATIVRGDSQFALSPSGELLIDNPMPRAGDFELIVEVTDPGGLSDRAVITAAIQEQAPPTIDDASFDISMPDAGTIIGTLTASDPNDDLPATGAFDIVAGDPNGLFAVDDNGVLTTTTAMDFPGTVELQVQVTDATGLTATAMITVRIGNLVFADGYEVQGV